MSAPLRADGNTVSDRIHAIAAQLSGVDGTLKMFAKVDDDLGVVPDALELLAGSVHRMNLELCAIADEISACPA